MKIKNITLWLFFIILGGLGLYTCTGSSTSKGSDPISQPNVIFIYADDLGRGLLSIEGQQIIKTPNIDRLANEGIRFERAYGTMFCAPARASLITGYHDAHGDKWQITRGGIYTNISTKKLTQKEIESRLNKQLDSVDTDEVFLAEVFKKAGYVTGEVGKLEWGFSATDAQMKRHGWDYYYGYLDHVRCHGFYPPFLFENGKLEEIKGNTITDCGKSKEMETHGNYESRWNMEGKSLYSQNIFLDKILAFIRKNKDSPFFLYHPTQLPHGPVAIPEVHEDYVGDDRLTQIEKEYASMVKMLDDHVGIILQELKKQGIDDNTMVIFSSDNGHEIYYTQEGRIIKPTMNMNTGEQFDNVTTKHYSELAGDIFDGNDGMAGIKRSNWEGGVRVPLIARWPGKILPGSTSNTMVTNYDLMATMAELLEVKLPEEKDGLSYLSELLAEGQKTEHEYIVYSSFMGPALVTKDGWKLRYMATKDIFQMYYLPDDYKEENNIISIHPEKAQKLKKHLLKECSGDLKNGWFQTKNNILPSVL